MAGDWIKFETSTPQKHEVWAISESLKIDPDAVVGKLLRVWTWFDQQTEKGNAPIVTKTLLDRLVCVTGFCDALISVGWMHQDSVMVSIPKFDRHNGQSAKTRALTAKRVSEHKGKKGNAQVTMLPLPREEKNREDKNNTKDKLESLPLPFDSMAFHSAWIEWCAFRRSKKKPISERAANKTLADFVKWGEQPAIDSMMDSIKNDWQGLFEPKTNHAKPKHAGIQQPELTQKGF